MAISNINMDASEFPEGFENLSWEEKEALTKGPNKEHIASYFLREVAPYVEGRENTFRTEGFSNLEQDQKISVYENIKSAILVLSLAHKQESLNWLKGKLVLVAEPGISYEGGQLKIGPGAMENEIANFIEEKSAEITQKNEISETKLEEIKEATDKNGEVIKIGDIVEWDLDGGSGRGEVVSFEREGSKIKASVYTDHSAQLATLFVDDIGLLKKSDSSSENLDTPQTEAIVGEENIEKPEYGEAEDWERLGDLRKQAVREELEQRKSGVLGLNSKWQDYENQKQLLEDKIKKTLREKVGENLTAEQENELKKEIQNTSYIELIEKEEKARHKDERNIKGETLTGKVLEKAKHLSNTVVLKWYFGLNKWARLGITTALATGIGVVVGNVAAGGALTYGGYRLARGAASFGAAGVANKWAQNRWSIDEINKDEQHAMESIKASEQSLAERSEFYRKVKEEADKERKWATGKKFLTTIGAGAGAGLLSGLTEHIFVDSDEMAKSVVEAQPIKSNIPEQAPKPIPPEPEVSVVPVAEKLFEDPDALRHEAMAGDSLWKILKNTLNNNEQFKGMTGAQKTYVISAITNKALQNPEEYGLGSGGSVYVGDKIDFTKLFENDKEMSSIFEKAQQTVAEGSPQESSILEQEAKIAEWVKNNPNAKLTTDKIPEILNTKPKVEDIVTVEEPNEVEIQKPEPAPQVQSEPQPEDNNAEVLAGGAALAGVGSVSVLTGKALIENEIEEAKKRLQVLEGGRGMRSMMGDISAEQGVEKAFRDEINSIYEQSGFLGFGKVPGINTKEWGEMARLPASKVVEYYTGDSTKSGLPNDILEKLTKSKNHNALMRQTAGLMEQANGAVKPFENENMEQFIKRLGGYVLRTYSQNLPKAA